MVCSCQNCALKFELWVLFLCFNHAFYCNSWAFEEKRSFFKKKMIVVVMVWLISRVREECQVCVWLPDNMISWWVWQVLQCRVAK
jgi:hypothetical protein